MEKIFMDAESRKKSSGFIFRPLFASIFIATVFSLLLSFLSGYGIAIAGNKVLVAQSLKVGPYEEALKGFESVQNSEIIRIFTYEMEETAVLKAIKRNHPDLILAIGMDALKKIKMVADIPVLYVMVLNPQSIVSNGDNVSGISMNISQEKQMGIVLDALPDLKTAGFLYNPGRTGELAGRAKRAAAEAGINLITREVHTPREVPSSIGTMKSSIDVFWMLPDITVCSPEVIEFLLLFSLENKIPIITFSGKYLKLGALMSIGIDAFDIGLQAGEMAEDILSNAVKVQRVDARKAVVTINLKIARKLGIQINENVLKRVTIID